MLSRNVVYMDAYTTWELSDKFWSNRRFQRHQYSENQKLISPIKRYLLTPLTDKKRAKFDVQSCLDERS
jgi:hypothetical protein